ncbi:MAG: hypothetical protein WAW86_03750 [Gammaproteobacteria bacterium]
MLSGRLFSSAAKSVNAEHVAVTNLINDSLNIFQDVLLLQRKSLISAASKKILYYKKPIQESWISTVKQQCYDFVSPFFLNMGELLLSLSEDILREVSMTASLQKEAAVHDLVIVELAITLIEGNKNHFQPKTSAFDQAYILEFLLGTLDKLPTMQHSSATVYDHLSPQIVTLSEMLKSINANLPIKMNAAKMLWNTVTVPVVPRLDRVVQDGCHHVFILDPAPSRGTTENDLLRNPASIELPSFRMHNN